MLEPHDTPAPPRHGSPRAEPRLQLLGISKSYPSVVANADIDLAVMPGEIHAVLGENGAGKSTLMKIIYGVTKPDAGEIMWEGKQVRIPSPAAARRLGIGMVFQHFALFETLTVAENIALALDEKSNPAQLGPRIRAVSERYGLALDPARRVHSMSTGERQRVEIVRCLLQSPRLIIMDEPTSVLTPDAVQKLFVSLRKLAEEGVSILYISHKLDEIRALCDKATVLRAGRVAGTAVPRSETAQSLARLMIGGELPGCSLAPRARGDVRRCVALYFDGTDGAWILPLMLLAGAAGGMAWAAVPALLRTRFNTSEILVSLMLVYVAYLFLGYLVHGPLRDPAGFNFPQSKMFGDAAMLPLLKTGLRVNAAFPLALLAAAGAWFFCRHTFAGYRMQVSGMAPAAALYAGFSQPRNIWLAFMTSGALAGVAGVGEVAGPLGQLQGSVSPGYGFAAIIVAYVGRLHPAGVVLASLLMSLLYIGGETAQIELQLPSAITGLFQGLLLFYLLAADLFIHYRFKPRTGPVELPAAPRAAPLAPETIPHES